MGYDKAPPLLVQKAHGTLVPYNGYTEQEMAGHVGGQVYTLKPRKGRTQPRNAAYWAGLSKAIENSDCWPTVTHLHDDLKRLCGYVQTYHNPLTGRDEVRVQSTAFDRMNESEFAAYFNLAQLRFIEIMQYDPWEREETP